jgi:RNA polymerase sigma-70 factor (ECF subfamily)
MVVVHGMSYEALAEATGCAVGTAKSRVFRARRQLESWLMGDTKETGRPSQRVGQGALLVQGHVKQCNRMGEESRSV